MTQAEMTGSGFHIEPTPPQKLLRMTTLRTLLMDEIKGLRKSSLASSALATIRKEYSLTGNRQAVYTRFCELIEQYRASAGVTQ